MSSARFDVVVVGAGLAGLAAAIRCAEQGLRVAVLERGAEERYPCNSRIAMGFINCAFEHIRAEPGVLRRAIDAQTRGFADPGLADAFADNAGPAVRWLADQGVRIVEIYGDGPRRRAVLAPPVPNRPGLNWPGRGSDVMVRRLTAKLEERGGRLLRGARARELITEGGRCAGVGATQGTDDVRFDAAAVVLADGGFQADEDLLRRYITARPDRLLQRNARTGTGDGLRMATAIGAQVRGMDRFYGHVQSRDAMTHSLLWPYPVADVPVAAGITVDSHARRFADEGMGGVFIANAIARLDDPLEAVAVFDQATWEGRARTSARPPNPWLTKVGATLHRSESIAGLAAMAGLPARALAASVAEFNQSLENGGLARLEPPRSGTFHTPVPIRKPPFYAVPLCAGITYTMGGIAIDARCRVLHADGHAIGGLFAAGSTTGGHEGGPCAGYTGGLGKAMTFGWHAGNCIAAKIRTDRCE